jgi:hypothetical protein
MTIDSDTKKAVQYRTEERVPKAQQYAMSYACLTCKTAQKRHIDGNYPTKIQCPICKDSMYNLGRHFKAPAKSDSKQWKKIAFLIEHGFLFQKIRPDKYSDESVPYPETLEDAKDFVVKYKDWAYESAL